VIEPEQDVLDVILFFSYLFTSWLVCEMFDEAFVL